MFFFVFGHKTERFMHDDFKRKFKYLTMHVYLCYVYNIVIVLTLFFPSTF
jgi:hypothetical protein